MKLLAAPAGDGVDAHAVGERSRHALEHSIANAVAETIVDQLEMVDVAHADHAGSRFAPGREFLHRAPTVEQARQRVPLSVVAGCFDLLAQVLDLARGVAQLRFHAPRTLDHRIDDLTRVIGATGELDEFG